MAPDELTPDRKKRQKHIKRNRDHTNGIDAVKDAGVVYLPSKSTHTCDADYQEYKDSTEYFPAAARTLQSFIGLVFRKQPKLTAPDAFTGVADAITADGMNLEQVARWCFREYCAANDGGVLIDHPAMPDGLSLAQAFAMDIRPFQARYAAENIRGMGYGVVGGRKRLISVRLSDDADTIRHLELIDGVYRVTILKRDKQEKVVDGTTIVDELWNEVARFVPLKAGKPLTYIPFVDLSDDDEGAPFDDLCGLNQTHYLHSARHNIAQLWLSKPQPWIAGVEDDTEFSVCEGTLWKFKDPTAKAEYLEYKGDGIPSIERTLDRIEQHMAMLGSRMLANEKAAAEAAETVARRQAGENSILASMARHVSGKVQEMLRIMAAWMGLDPATVGFALNTDFIPATIDSALLKELVGLKQANELTDREFFDALQRGEIISEATDYETRRAELDATLIDQPIPDDSGE